jgi:hypothetical protein
MKYKEAIERLKQWDREHPNGYAINERDEFIFPELREINIASATEVNIDDFMEGISYFAPEDKLLNIYRRGAEAMLRYIKAQLSIKG